jgi:hypothetical protein
MVDEAELLACADKLAFDTQKAADAAAVVADYQHATVHNICIYMI